MEILNTTILGNSVGNYLLAIAIFLFGFFLRNLFSKVLGRANFIFLRKFTRKEFLEEFIQLLRAPFNFLILLLTIYFAFYPLDFPEDWHVLSVKEHGLKFYILRTYQALLVVAISWLCLRNVDFIFFVYRERLNENEEQRHLVQMTAFFRDLVKFVLVIIGILIILGTVFTLDVTSLVAGLGIGGLAIALAAQETLSNLLGSFIIFLDKPFKTGDLVSVDNITGVIEKVGLRSTRIRTLDKSLITVPNKKLINDPLNNVTLSPLRRVKFPIGLAYSTSSEKLSKIISEIKQELDKHPQVSDEYTVVFHEFRENSLELLIIYFVMTNDGDVMTMVKEFLNFRVMEIIKRNEAEFALPTTTIFVDKRP